MLSVAAQETLPLPAGVVGDVGDVGAPQPVRAVGGEPPPDEVVLGRGQRILDRGLVDRAGLVEDLRRRLDDIAGAAGAVACTVEPVPGITADHLHLERVVLNLVRNALEATAPVAGGTSASVGQEARVRARVAPAPTGRTGDTGPFRERPGWGAGRTAPGVVLEVADSGRGMTDEVCARAVEPFFRADTSAGGAGLGLGLGLAIVYGIVRQHGGNLDIDSTPGADTTVRITLPVDPVTGAATGH